MVNMSGTIIAVPVVTPTLGTTLYRPKTKTAKNRAATTGMQCPLWVLFTMLHMIPLCMKLRLHLIMFR